VSVRNYSNTAAQSTLSASIAATDTTITLINYVGDPTPPFTAALARGTANEEIVLVTGVAGSTATVTRAYDGTTAKAQAAGTTFQEVVVALDFREANNHVNSGSSGAHGTTSQLVGVSDTQTLTNKTLTAPTISNPTITGTETVATSNITTLNVSGVSTLASAAVTGNATVGGTLAVTGATSLSGTLAVTGLLTASGGLTVPTGKVATITDAPAAGTSAVNKAYADALGVSTATASSIARRDSSGRLQVADPSASADAATKNYVDGKFADGGWQTISPNSPMTALGTCRYRVLNGVCYYDLATSSPGGVGAGFVVFSFPGGARPSADYYAVGIGGNGATPTQVTVSASSGAMTIALATGAGSFIVSGSYPVT
jgi:hypothetical protein